MHRDRSTELVLDDAGTGADAVLMLTVQVQEGAIDAVWTKTGSAAWPECSAHRHGHYLDCGQHEGRVYWFCPQTGHVVSEVGHLGLSRDQEAFAFTLATYDPFPGDRLTEEEAEALAAEMRTQGAPDARIGRIGLRNVVEFSDGLDGVLSVMDRDGWVHLREVLAHRPAQPRTPQGGVVGGIIGWVPPQDATD